MKIFENKVGIVQLDLNTQKFDLIIRITNFIKENYAKSDILSLRYIKYCQVNKLAAALTSVPASGDTTNF